MRPRLPWIVGALGAAAIVGGVLVLFLTDHGARSAFLLTFGVLLVLIAALGRRIEVEGFEILGAKLRVREVVRKRLEMAESGAGVDAARASAPQQQAVVLQKLVSLYGIYQHIRLVEPPGDYRTGLLDELAEQMRSVGRQAEFEPPEVIAWFHEGTDALRVIALNLMLENEDYRDFLAVLDTIDAPHSLFEQFYGVLLAEEMAPELDSLQRRLLADAIDRAARKRRFKRDRYLPARAERLLKRLGEPSEPRFGEAVDAG